MDKTNSLLLQLFCGGKGSPNMGGQFGPEFHFSPQGRKGTFDT